MVSAVVLSRGPPCASFYGKPSRKPGLKGGSCGQTLTLKLKETRQEGPSARLSLCACARVCVSVCAPATCLPAGLRRSSHFFLSFSSRIRGRSERERGKERRALLRPAPAGPEPPRVGRAAGEGRPCGGGSGGRRSARGAPARLLRSLARSLGRWQLRSARAAAMSEVRLSPRGESGEGAPLAFACRLQETSSFGAGGAGKRAPKLAQIGRSKCGKSGGEGGGRRPPQEPLCNFASRAGGLKREGESDRGLGVDFPPGGLLPRIAPLPPAQPNLGDASRERKAHHPLLLRWGASKRGGAQPNVKEERWWLQKTCGGQFPRVGRWVEVKIEQSGSTTPKVGTRAITNFGGSVRGGRNATTQRVWAAPFVAIW